MRNGDASKGLPLLFLLALTLGLTCAPAAPATGAFELLAFEEPHMGTLFKVKFYAPPERSSLAARAAATAAFARIDEINEICSDYIHDSQLNRLQTSPPDTPVPISEDLYEVLERALTLAEKTDGAFDPTVGHYTNLWRRSLRKGTLPTSEQLSAVRAKSGYRHLHLEGAAHHRTATLRAPGLHLDLGGIAKGYAADRALATLKAHGFTRAAVAAGGDIRVGDPPPGQEAWIIPILSPEREREALLTTVALKNAAVSSSGDREQFVEIDGRTYSHIVDPRTGLGLTRRISATVVAPNATLSDSHATALCVLGPEKGISLVEKIPGVEALIVITNDRGEEQRSSTTGFPGELESNQ